MRSKIMDIQEITKNLVRKNVPQLRAGQVIRVHERIKEGDKERVQVFEGLVIAAKHGSGLDGTFTVRKIGAGGVGVERIFPLHMPAIEKIEILRQERVRRAKLYYVRGQVGKKTKKRKTKLQNLIFDMGGTEEKLEEPADAEEAAEKEASEAPQEPEVQDAEEKAEAVPDGSEEEPKEEGKTEDKKEGAQEEEK